MRSAIFDSWYSYTTQHKITTQDLRPPRDDEVFYYSFRRCEEGLKGGLRRISFVRKPVITRKGAGPDVVISLRLSKTNPLEIATQLSLLAMTENPNKNALSRAAISCVVTHLAI